MRALLRAGHLSLALLLVGCAPSATVTKGGGATIGEAQAEHYDGPRRASRSARSSTRRVRRH